MKPVTSAFKHVSTFFTLACFILFLSPRSASADPGIGGSGGGPRVGQLVTVQVCNDGESGELCRMVTYRIRPKSPPTELKCYVSNGEGGEVPCPEKLRIPGWLKRLNDSFN
jgi:hypothetical protein